MSKIGEWVNPNNQLQCGMVFQDGEAYYVISSQNKKGHSNILSFGKGYGKNLLPLSPIPVNTCFTETKVSFCSETLGNETPETWLDRNEERLVPPGFTPDQVVHEWNVDYDTLYSAVVTKESLAQFRAQVDEKAHLLRSITVPLWDLAKLYAKSIDGPFVIWKIEANGSLLGFVLEGHLHSFCNLWVDYKDLYSGPTTIGNDLGSVIKSLSQGHSCSQVVPLVIGEKQDLPSSFIIPGYTLIEPPKFDSLPHRLHEAYACSHHERVGVDFASIVDVHGAERLDRKRKLFLQLLFGSLVTIVTLLVLVGAGIGILAAIERGTEKRIKPYQSYIKEIEQGERKLKRLKRQYKKKARFFQRESVLTHLIDTIQVIFPEGAWAEQIEMSERDNSSWDISIIACAYSTALIPSFLQSLEQVSAIDEVRMIYSEQVKEKGKKRVIKIKVEALWHPKEMRGSQ